MNRRPIPEDYGAEKLPDGSWHWHDADIQDDYSDALRAWNPRGGDGIFYHGEPPLEEGK